MKAFEDGKFNEWKQRTEQTLPGLQKHNVLKELPIGESRLICLHNCKYSFAFIINR